MNKNYMTKGAAILIVLLLSCVTLVSSTEKNTSQDNQPAINLDIQSNDIENTVPITVSIYGKTGIEIQTTMISLDEATEISSMFKEIRQRMVTTPSSTRTQQLQQDLLCLLQAKGAFPTDVSTEDVQSLLQSPGTLPRTHPRPISPFPAKATEFMCTFISEGSGNLLPIILLPRFIPILLTPIPRVIVVWNVNEGFTSCGGLRSGTGFIAYGQQKGVALGFWGLGLTFSIPPMMNTYGLAGYALYASVAADYIEYYPPNIPPEITQTDPADGQQMVPTSTNKLSFEIIDEDGDLMSYNVTTYPDIGSGSGGLKPDGIYSISLSGLDSLTTYTCVIQVTDGKDTVEKTITFTTEPTAPIVSNPMPDDDERDVPMNLPQLQFTLKDYQGDALEYTVQTSPDVGSDHKTGVHDGTYTVPISGMEFGAEYRWYVNVTDGTHWARKTYRFSTGYPSPFDPFEYGWQYRKSITIDHTEVAGDLDSFPVLFSTTDPDLTKAQADGDDLLFMTGAGAAVKLRHELEVFDQSTGDLVAWVNIPSLSSDEDTTFYLYYGNTGCIDQEYAEKTWNQDFSGVWHLKESTGTRYDSTGNTWDCISSGTTHTTSAKIHGGEIFNQRPDSIYTISSPESMSQFTMECWVAFSTEEADPATGGDVFMNIHQNDPSVFRDEDERYYVWADGNQKIGSTRTFRDTDWHYVSVVATGSSIMLYVDTVMEGSAAWDGTSSSTNPFYIGDNRLGTDYFFGTIDEVRLSTIARDLDWITTCYQNQNDPVSFINVGPEEPHP